MTLANLEFIFSRDFNRLNPMQVFLFTISIGVLAVYAVAPLILTTYFKANVHKFFLSTYNFRFKEAINDLNRKGRSSPNHFVIFCYRRLLANLLIVFLRSYSSS